MKPVGERRAGNPHAAFDERGKETEQQCGLRHRYWAKAAGQQLLPTLAATAPFLDSTIPTRRIEPSKFSPNNYLCTFGAHLLEVKPSGFDLKDFAGSIGPLQAIESDGECTLEN